METKLTFAEKFAVANAITLRISDLSDLIYRTRQSGIDTSALCEVRDDLKVAYRKLTGTDFTFVHHD